MIDNYVWFTNGGDELEIGPRCIDSLKLRN